MVPDRNSNTGLESRVLFSNTVLEFVFENRTPPGSLRKTCNIFEHGSGSGCAKFDQPGQEIPASSIDSPKYGWTSVVAGDFLKTVFDCSIHADSPHVTLYRLRNSCSVFVLRVFDFFSHG
jgi:hypothetical protein